MRVDILMQALQMCRHDRCPCCPEYKHFCIAFRGKKILATGYNCRCRIPKRLLGRTSSNHAETSTIFKVRDGKPYDILVIRINRDGTKLLISKPCPVCSEWIERSHIGKIFYSDGQGHIILTDRKHIRDTHRRHHRSVIIVSM
uniref:CMP/dCMP-type deaminase domain-containing protein n=1 Tax=viral metagenome TaxID=1070528 RepID=A0A6C0JSP7_9ZZZZ